MLGADLGHLRMLGRRLGVVLALLPLVGAAAGFFVARATADSVVSGRRVYRVQSFAEELTVLGLPPSPALPASGLVSLLDADLIRPELITALGEETAASVEMSATPSAFSAFLPLEVTASDSSAVAKAHELIMTFVRGERRDSVVTPLQRQIDQIPAQIDAQRVVLTDLDRRLAAAAEPLASTLALERLSAASAIAQLEDRKVELSEFVAGADGWIEPMGPLREASIRSGVAPGLGVAGGFLLGCLGAMALLAAVLVLDRSVGSRTRAKAATGVDPLVAKGGSEMVNALRVRSAVHAAVPRVVTLGDSALLRQATTELDETEQGGVLLGTGPLPVDAGDPVYILVDARTARWDDLALQASWIRDSGADLGGVILAGTAG